VSECTNLWVCETSQQRDDIVHHVLVVDDAVLALVHQCMNELTEVWFKLLVCWPCHYQWVVTTILYVTQKSTTITNYIWLFTAFGLLKSIKHTLTLKLTAQLHYRTQCSNSIYYSFLKIQNSTYSIFFTCQKAELNMLLQNVKNIKVKKNKVVIFTLAMSSSKHNASGWCPCVCHM